MKQIYVDPTQTLDLELEKLVRSHLRPGELVVYWSHDIEGDVVTVLLIEEDVHRELAEFSLVMGRLCAGGGRTMSFKRIPTGWSLVDESGWIS